MGKKLYFSGTNVLLSYGIIGLEELGIICEH